MIYSNEATVRKTVAKKESVVSESISSEMDSKFDINDSNTSKHLCYTEYTENAAATPQYHNPVAANAFNEYFDLTDSVTRKAVIAMNEADQGTVLTALTSKLYDNIVSKVDDIDYGDIPASKGDITKLPNYEKLCECVSLLKGILHEYKQDTYPIDTISTAISNVAARKDMFNRAFRMNTEMPIVMYNNTVLAIVSSVSYMIATCIEFIKTPNQDTFEIVLDKVAYAKTKSNLLYSNLGKFNTICANGKFDKAMEHIIKTRAMNESIMGTASIVIAAIGAVLCIIPILREIVFFFYYSRMRVSEFFDIQADLLQMNTYNVKNNETMDEEKKKHVVSSQLRIVEFFRKIANKISINNRKAEVDATKEIDYDSKKLKINDVTKELPDSVSVLF